MVFWFGGQTVPAYIAANGGAARLTKELSNDWIARGVHVNSIVRQIFSIQTHMRAALPRRAAWDLIYSADSYAKGQLVCH